MVATYFNVYPEEANRVIKEAEEYEKEEEQHRKEEYNEIEKHVNSLTKQELREQLISYIINEKERRYWWFVHLHVSTNTIRRSICLIKRTLSMTSILSFGAACADISGGKFYLCSCIETASRHVECVVLMSRIKDWGCWLKK